MTRSEQADDGVTLSLTHEEALVLFEWLHSSEGTHAFSDQAEQRVLWDLEASLERQLASLFSQDYLRLLQDARARLRDSQD